MDLLFSDETGKSNDQLGAVEGLPPGELQAVEITTKAEGRSRLLTASITVPRALEQVWQVLTDYEALADFIPNLAESNLSHDSQGRILLEQVGSQNVLFLNFSARVVLLMEEHYPNEIRFEMQEGDFQEFRGCWQLDPEAEGSRLTYRLQVLPKRLTPVIAIERCLKRELSANLLAVRQQVCERYPTS
ncbi:SRPBCC family protein [Leptolyngbya sp. FACHB-261]|uniref:SRPBCC family protein n=1 Tax=Leptolyngbya sp. FACHB-261 TaxID=2692806 RepID=UPI0016842099|nr:SRPBCC family protein [Leptolyngbya sp. FACHB-261]MBD2100839.1 SRPBCC family protein [Leptolyngbya sp. FACHB-261]